MTTSMHETWYEVTSWAAKVQPVTVVKKTDKTVTLQTRYGVGTRDVRRLIGVDFYPTEVAALEYLVGRYEARGASLRIELEVSERTLTELRNKLSLKIKEAGQ